MAKISQVYSYCTFTVEKPSKGKVWGRGWLRGKGEEKRQKRGGVKGRENQQWMMLFFSMSCVIFSPVENVVLTGEKV